MKTTIYPIRMLLIFSAMILAATDAIMGPRGFANVIKPAAKTGGSNYGWYAVDGCQRHSIISEFNIGRKTITQQLNQMYSGGQRRLRIPIFFNISDGTQYIESQQLIDQSFLENIMGLVSLVRKAGFQEILIALFPYGKSDPRSWTTWNEQSYQASLQLVQSIESIMSASRLKYKVDLSNEGITEHNQGIAFTYLQRLWSDYVHQFGTSNTVGFSIDPTIGRLKNIEHVYGTHLPAALDIHLYSDASRKIADAARVLNGTTLNDTPWIIGETYYTDESESAVLSKSLVSSGHLVEFLLQWPWKRGGVCQQVNSIPLDFESYLQNGF